MSESLKVMTCGNVDDGKSTLLGRLFFETNNVLLDQSKYLESHKKHNKEIDYSLLLDGLIDEKLQGITIDIAFKYVYFGKKKFMFIDSPGHIEYTRNMANAATFANVAIVLFDVTKPLSEQTKNHLKIINLFPNIKKIILVYNKIDKLNYKKSAIDKSTTELENYIKDHNIKVNHRIPVSALNGDNITKRSKNTSYYNGASLYEVLNGLQISNRKNLKYSVLHIQNIAIHNEKRIYFAKNYGKSLLNDEHLKNISTGESAEIKKIYSDESLVKKVNNQNIAIELKNNISLTGGDILSNSKKIKNSNSFKISIFVTSKNNIELNKRYLFKFRHTEVNGFINSNSTSELLKVNGIYEATVETEKNIPISNFKDMYEFSQFIIIDKYLHETVGFGYIKYSLDKGTNIHYQKIEKYFSNTNSKAVWFTGLPGSGKTTLANALGRELKSKNIPFYILDGDNVRKTINQDLGFQNHDRIENNRRIAYIAKMLIESNITPIISTVSPNRDSREFSRELLGNENFLLVYLNTPLEKCIERDPKNLYKNEDKVIKNITGIDDKYDVPLDANITLDTSQIGVKKCVNTILNKLLLN